MFIWSFFCDFQIPILLEADINRSFKLCWQAIFQHSANEMFRSEARKKLFKMDLVGKM